ncbi:hypothetical protein Salat_0477700 [Sesamum alatum]|uniref:Uncharacterized protein n=1 Tax=Sesamum alatum TaxID=300844 RepID=A0AAE1Z4P4_9LAMI|nr:hypothetical protein Salat_0477700 [Sesamum alatum]
MGFGLLSGFWIVRVKPNGLKENKRNKMRFYSELHPVGPSCPWTHQEKHRPTGEARAAVFPEHALTLMAENSVLGNNDIDDVRWLCSLTESELDLLMGLKNLANMRAEKIGHEVLAKKFDLRMLRSLSVTFMKHLKEQLKDVPATSGFDCNLLKQNLSSSFGSMTVDELYPYICSDQRKRIADKFLQEMPPSQRQKTSN